MTNGHWPCHWPNCGSWRRKLPPSKFGCIRNDIPKQGRFLTKMRRFLREIFLPKACQIQFRNHNCIWLVSPKFDIFQVFAAKFVEKYWTPFHLRKTFQYRLKSGFGEGRWNYAVHCCELVQRVRGKKVHMLFWPCPTKAGPEEKTWKPLDASFQNKLSLKSNSNPGQELDPKVEDHEDRLQ